MNIKNIFSGLFYVSLGIFAAIIAISVLDLPGNFSAYSVQSGSMEPAIKKGALVVVKPYPEYKKGDMVTIVNPDKTATTLTHRIFAVTKKAENVYYTTKGDANNAPDRQEIHKKDVKGKVLASIPLVGYLTSFTKTKVGLLTLIIIPSLFIIYFEIIKIKTELTGLQNTRKSGKFRVEKIVSVILLLSIISVHYVRTTNSKLLNLEQISGNKFTAATWANPRAILSLSADRRTASFVVEEIKDFEKITYSLSYDSLQGAQGIIGNATLSAQETFNKSGLTLGTCTSGGNCIYHTGVNNLQLNVELTDREGNITTLQTE